jgi:hypothetical protein
MKIQVRATAPCFVNGRLQAVGDVFDVELERVKTKWPKCMERIDGKPIDPPAAPETPPDETAAKPVPEASAAEPVVEPEAAPEGAAPEGEAEPSPEAPQTKKREKRPK